MNYIISIMNPAASEVLDEICKELKIPLTASLPGHGTAVKSMLDLLGIESNEKRVVTAVADRETTAKFIEAQKKYLHIGVPGHGIVIAIPIKSIGGGTALAYLNGDKTAKYTPPTNYAYELIIAITNAGNTDLVMNAARSAGARGGTVIHGKGTGAKEDERFYNISLAEEKEIILIVSSAEHKSEIMKAILKDAGPESRAGTILFSLPTTEVAGFGLFDEN